MSSDIVEIFDINELKMIESGILKEIHKFCEDNKLLYSLWGGTLIGAVRHNGFIPWDDDIDICMPRKDYEFFCTHFATERYGVFSCETNELYPFSFAKAYDKYTIKREPIRVSRDFSIGIDVDIFPIDEIENKGIVTSEIIAERWKTIKGWRRSCIIGSRYKLIAFLRHLRPVFKKPNLYARDLNTSIKRLSSYGNPQKNLILFADTNLCKPLFIERDIFDRRLLHDFEDEQFYITADYDYILTACYGDYMTPPPKEKQVAHHSFKAYRKNKS